MSKENIEYIKKSKEKAIEEIQAIVDKFKDETGLCFRDIDLQLVNVTNGDKFTIVQDIEFYL